jgi:small subunit ribosomal protein S15
MVTRFLWLRLRQAGTRKDTMALSAETKLEVIKKFRQDEKDTGSPEVQIALLTASIEQLTDHLKTHKKDDHSRLGLLKQVAKRRRLLNFLTRTNEQRYKKLIKALKLSK